MLTIRQITDNTDAVVRGLEKKHFKNAKETIGQVLALNNKRKSTQAARARRPCWTITWPR